MASWSVACGDLEHQNVTIANTVPEEIPLEKLLVGVVGNPFLAATSYSIVLVVVVGNPLFGSKPLLHCCVLQ